MNQILTSNIVSIVIPLYNEEDTIPFLTKRLEGVLSRFPIKTEIVFVNDGSNDNTHAMIKKVAQEKSNFVAVNLSRNFGHQMAVSAGLSICSGTEAILVMDGDLQDPPELVSKFYEKFKEGYDVVYAVRKKRKEGFFKKAAYKTFYRLLNSISYIKLPLDSGDFCLMSRRVVDTMNKMPEESRYLRGMRSWIGYKQVGIEYERAERAAGEPKYDFKMLLKLAYNGIFNFSDYPIKLVTRIGIFGMVASSLYLSYVLYLRLTSDVVPTGFTGLLLIITLFGSLQLISIGMIGEYIIRIFFQVKKRPLFIIDEITKKNE